MPPGLLRDRIDELVLRHARPTLDADGGSKLDKLALPVSLPAAVRGLFLPRARAPLARRAPPRLAPARPPSPVPPPRPRVPPPPPEAPPRGVPRPGRPPGPPR